MSFPRLLATVFVAVSLGAQSPTYMQVGNTVHAFGGDSVALMDTGAQTLTALSVVPPSTNVVALTWDPNSPDDLIVAATDNRIYRSTVTSSGVSISVLMSSGLGGMRQLSWDQTGQLIVVGESGGDVMWRVDPVSGVRTPILSWPIAGVRCGRQDQQNGDYYLGGSAGLWRVTGVPTGTPSVTLVAPTTSSITSLAFDPAQPEWLLFTRSQNLYRMNKNTFAVEPVWTGAQAVDLIRTAHAGGLRGIHGRNVFDQGNPAVIPAGGVPPVLIGTNSNIGCCSLVDAAIIGATFTPFRLQIESLPGCGATFEIKNPPVGTSTSWMFFSATTTFPVGTGPMFGLVPDGVTLVFMNTFATAQPGNFLHSLGPPPQTTVLPPGILCFLTGQTWDVVVASWGPALQFSGRTNVQRLTWQ